MPSLPKDVKEAVKKCREATQEALQKQKSRMDIEFPVGTKFNVERLPKKKNTQKKQPPTQADLQRSDRELARIFVDMFQPVGGDQIAVVFNDVDAADEAKKKWKDDSTAKSRILSLDRRKSDQKKKKTVTKKKGFAAKLAQEMADGGNTGETTSGPFHLPDNTEVAMFVAPGPKELIIVEKICQQAGMETLIVLLNARTSLIEQWNTEEAAQLFQHEFETVFHLAAAPQDVAPNCLLYRAYPGKWTMARKPAVGAPLTILSSDERPNSVQCKDVFEGLEISQVEKKVEGALEGVASWFS